MKLLFISILLFVLNSSILAHPHTFIEVEPTLSIKDEKITKFNIKWTLDEMTSMMLIMELDNNGNGKLEKDEQEFIYENYFSSLDKYNFYMNISSQKQVLIIEPKEFKALIEKGKLIYSFEIKNNINLKDLKIDFFDKDLYVGMMLEKEYIKLVGIDKNKSLQLKKDIFGVK